MKKLLCALLALVMCLSLLPAGVFAAGDVAINSTNFPDAAFRQSVKDQFDKDGNGKLSAAEIRAATHFESIISSMSEVPFQSVKGIEYLTELREVYICQHDLTALDVSKLTKLEVLVCWENRLTALDVSKNTALRELYCLNNNIQSLDLTKNHELRELHCVNNLIETLELSGCPYLADAVKNGESAMDGEIREIRKGAAPAGSGWSYTGYLACDGEVQLLNNGAVMTPPDFEPGWRTNNGYKWYQYGDGTYPADETVTIGGADYTFDYYGFLVNGWYNSRYYKDGRPQSGWQTIDGKKYYLTSAGAKTTGWKTIGGKQ